MPGLLEYISGDDDNVRENPSNRLTRSAAGRARRRFKQTEKIGLNEDDETGSVLTELEEDTSANESSDDMSISSDAEKSRRGRRSNGKRQKPQKQKTRIYVGNKDVYRKYKDEDENDPDAGLVEADPYGEYRTCHWKGCGKAFVNIPFQIAHVRKAHLYAVRLIHVFMANKYAA